MVLIVYAVSAPRTKFSSERSHSFCVVIIPAIHVAMTNLAGKPSNRGPIVVIISTTVDQAIRAQRMNRDLGGPIGIRSALGVGTGGDVIQELRLLQQSMPHILCSTPQKLHALFTSPGVCGQASIVPLYCLESSKK